MDVAALRRSSEAGQDASALRNALDHLDEVIDQGGDLSWLANYLRAHGLVRAALQVDGQRVGRGREDAAERLSLIRSVHLDGDPWWARELLDELDWDNRESRALRIDIGVALGEDVGELVDAWLDEFADEDALECAIPWYLCSSHLVAAERALRERAGAPLWHARLALWRQQPELAAGYLADLGDSTEVRCLNAIVSLQRGDCDGAEAAFREIAAAGETNDAVRTEAWSWLATILRKSGRYDEAVQAADAASQASPDFSLAPRIEREIAVNRGERPARPSWLDRMRGKPDKGGYRTVGDLEYAELLCSVGADPQEYYIDALERAIEQLGGNRTTTPTVIGPDGLQTLRLPADPRHHGATIQRVLWTRGIEAVRELFRTHQAEVGAHPLSLIYQGEVELWVGEYAAAERIFRRALAIEKKTLWASIGLGAARMFQGSLDEALEVWRRGVELRRFEGPTLFVYRGECHRRLRMPDEARRDLETAIAQKPQRLSAWINLALLDGDEKVVAEAMQKCEHFAPILMQELQGTASQRLEGVLEAMRGNRSSVPDHMLYFLWGHLWSRRRG